MSRRLNLDTVPMHKPGAYSQRGLVIHDLRNDCSLSTLALLAFHVDVSMCKCWSLTYVATPIAVAVSEGLFTGSVPLIR